MRHIRDLDFERPRTKQLNPRILAVLLRDPGEGDAMF